MSNNYILEVTKDVFDSKIETREAGVKNSILRVVGEFLSFWDTHCGDSDTEPRQKKYLETADAVREYIKFDEEIKAKAVNSENGIHVKCSMKPAMRMEKYKQDANTLSIKDLLLLKAIMECDAEDDDKYSKSIAGIERRLANCEKLLSEITRDMLTLISFVNYYTREE